MCGYVKWRGQSQHFGKKGTAESLAEREIKCAEGAQILTEIFSFSEKDDGFCSNEICCPTKSVI